MSLGAEYFKAYSLSVDNCAFLTTEQHNNIHHGLYVPEDGALYRLQQANYNRDTLVIGTFHPLQFVEGAKFNEEKTRITN